MLHASHTYNHQNFSVNYGMRCYFWLQQNRCIDSFGHSGTMYCSEQDTTPQHFLSSRHKKDDHGSTNKRTNCWPQWLQVQKTIPNITYMEIHIVHHSISRNNSHSYQEISKLFLLSERKLPDKNWKTRKKKNETNNKTSCMNSSVSLSVVQELLTVTCMIVTNLSQHQSAKTKLIWYMFSNHFG
jgi:hypothetical protein